MNAPDRYALLFPVTRSFPGSRNYTVLRRFTCHARFLCFLPSLPTPWLHSHKMAPSQALFCHNDNHNLSFRNQDPWLFCIHKIFCPVLLHFTFTPTWLPTITILWAPPLPPFTSTSQNAATSLTMCPQDSSSSSSATARRKLPGLPKPVSNHFLYWSFSHL